MNREIPILDIQDLTKSFQGKKAVDNLNFKVNARDIFGFLGPNGAGKTTTIRMILGLIRPDTGTVKIRGYDIQTQFEQAISQVGAIVESPKFYPNLSGYDNLLLIKNLYPHVKKERIDEVIEIVGLTQRAKDMTKTYSLGMKQRLGIARTLVNYPKIIFLDEPTNGLDPQGIQEIREMISQLALEQDITFFITSHLLYEVEQICNRVAIVKEGRLITQGNVQDLIKKENERLKIYTPSLSQAQIILKESPKVLSIEEFPGGLIVDTIKGSSSELNQLLNGKGIPIEYLIPAKHSLEEIFLQLTDKEELR